MTTCGLYIFDFEDGGAYHYTSAEEPIDYDEDTYEAVPITRGRPSERAVGEIEKAELEVRLDGQIEVTDRFVGTGPTGEVRLTMYTAERDDIDDTLFQLFSGIVVSWSRDEKEMQLQVAPRRVDLEQDGPRGRYSTRCRHRLYSEGCGVSSDFFEQEYDIVGADPDRRLVTVIGTSLVDENFFLNGYLKYADHGRRIISQSEPEDFGDDLAYTLKLDYWIDGLESASSAILAPGCQHDIITCHDRFSNHVNFGGFTTLENLIESPFGRDIS